MADGAAWARQGRVIGLLGVVGVVAAGPALIAAAALSDAWYRCPGIQCSDALWVGSVAAGVSLAILIAGLVVVLRAGRRNR